MAGSICATCLSRLRASSKLKLPISPITLSATSSFHTTAPQSDVVKKKKGVAQPKKLRESTSAQIKKSKRVKEKPPAVGERKAQRKRIVLSNTNALEISDMADLTPENMADDAMVAKILGLEGKLLDQLREAKAFKPTQNWNMFRRPATLVRKETISLGEKIRTINESVGGEVGMGPSTIRQIIAGDRSTGKSLLLVQAMSMAYLNKWIVINVPEAQDFTIGQSSYAPLEQSEYSQEDQKYMQPQLTAALLSRAANSNGEVLKGIPVSPGLTISGEPVSEKMSLRDLAMMGAQDVNSAWPVWQAFWRQIAQPAKDAKIQPPPVLIAIDGLDHWMGFSKYRSAEYELIHAHQLALIRQFVSMLFSQPSTSANLANGGMILAATSGSNSPTLPDFTLLLRQLKARASGLEITSQDFPMPEPYRKHDQRVLDLLGGSAETTVQTLQGLSRDESRGLLEYFAKSGILKETVTEAIVGEKWSLSGGGVIGEMAKFGKRVRL